MLWLKNTKKEMKEIIAPPLLVHTNVGISKLFVTLMTN